MRIVFAASELSPLAHTGALGEVLAGLPAALAARGHHVTICLPCYRGLRENPALAATATGVEFPVQVGARRWIAQVLQATAPSGVQLFLIRRDELFDRATLYGEGGRAYDDNAERFIFFSKAVVELVRRLQPPAEIVHAHDWQTALIPLLLRERRLPIRSVLTIHNIAYQGSFWAPDFALLNLPGEYFTARGVEFYGQVNLLKGGLLHADRLTTVSQHYAREIQTAEFGAGLDAVVRAQAPKLEGILSGVSEQQWNPAADPALAQSFSARDLAGKRACREALLAECALAPAPTGPVLAMVGRIAAQKGFDLLVPLLDRLLAHDVRLLILGEGDARFERELAIASRRHRERFLYQRTAESPLAHHVYAGADLLLAPAHSEPSGSSAMIALRYGAIPIAHAVGGLSEILRDDDPTSDAGNAILFHEASPAAFWDAIVRALSLYADAPAWQRLVQRAMSSDFSWARAAIRYEATYLAALRARR